MNPVEVLRDGLALLDECPYRDAVDPGMHSGCGFCADREDERAALADVEALVQAARPALDMLAAEAYYRHREGGFPVSAEYEDLAAALRPFGDSGKESAA